MKIMILSSLSKDSGCWLRAGYLAKALKPWARVELVEALPKTLPSLLEVALTFPYNLLKVLLSDADFFIGMKPFPNVTIPLAVAKFIKRKKTAVDIDDLDYGFFSGWKARTIAFAQKPLPRFFDVITYHNDALAEHIVSAFGVDRKKLYKLVQGIDRDTFSGGDGTCEKDLLFFMGNLNLGADLAPILSAVAIVRQKRPVNLTIVGGGPFERGFKRLAAELGINARFTGAVAKEVAAQELARADVCLVYFAQKTANLYRCSMKLNEYLAMGKKVVCNDFGELKKFQEYVYGASSDLDDFAAKIIAALDGGDGREIKGQAHVRQELDWAAIGERYFFDALKAK